MAHLVAADAPRQVAQHRLLAGRVQRLVVGRRAHLDDAARGQLLAAGGLEVVHRAQPRVLLEEVGVGAVPVEFRPDVPHIGLQGTAVLQFFRLPVLAQPGADLVVVAEAFQQVAGVGVAAALDEGCAADEQEHGVVVAHALGFDGGKIDVGERPGHLSSGLNHDGSWSNPCSRTTVATPQAPRPARAPASKRTRPGDRGAPPARPLAGGNARHGTNGRARGLPIRRVL